MALKKKKCFLCNEINFVMITDNMDIRQATIAQLQRAGLRPSMQRVAILEYINQHYTHPTVEEIYDALSKEMPTLSKTTVYNTLRSLAETGLALSLTLDGKYVHYDGTVRPHAHCICSRCGHIEDVYIENDAFWTLPQLPKMKINQVEISYFGLCDRCTGNKEM